MELLAVLLLLLLWQKAMQALNARRAALLVVACLVGGATSLRAETPSIGGEVDAIVAPNTTVTTAQATPHKARRAKWRAENRRVPNPRPVLPQGNPPTRPGLDACGISAVAVCPGDRR